MTPLFCLLLLLACYHGTSVNAYSSIVNLVSNYSFTSNLIYTNATPNTPLVKQPGAQYWNATQITASGVSLALGTFTANSTQAGYIDPVASDFVYIIFGNWTFSAIGGILNDSITVGVTSGYYSNNAINETAYFLFIGEIDPTQGTGKYAGADGPVFINGTVTYTPVAGSNNTAYTGTGHAFVVAAIILP